MKGLETADERALNDLVSAIIVQAAMDYVDARKAGLITSEGGVDEIAIRRLMLRRAHMSQTLPKWLKPRDVLSCAWFIHSHAMQDIMPHNWSVNPDAIRAAVVTASESADGNINHHMKKRFD